MNYIKITKTDIANGLGVRVTLWVSGCTCHCKGCQNPETWDFQVGKPFTEDTMKELIEALSKPWIKGLTLSGGHPLEIQSLHEVQHIVQTVRERLPEKDIWLYTGRNISMKSFSEFKGILDLCDVVVDGPFIESQKDLTLAFRGSRNQNLIDVKRTLQEGRIVTLPEEVKYV